MAVSPILYPYQRRYLADPARFKAGMWSRQTGKTFTTTLEAVLDVLEAEIEGSVRCWTILSVSRDRALDAMEKGVKLHLRAIGQAFEALDVPIDKEELAHMVRIGSRGSYIRAVASKPSTARGMSDNLILDEFAHHQDSRAIWTALLPVVSRPDLKLRVISTPNGKGNKFYEIMTGMDGLFSRHVITIYDAVADGLPRDIDELRRAMGDPIAWAQEYECQFIDEATAWLPFDLIDGCEDPDSPGEYQGGPCYVGMDFAARGDLTVIAVLEEVGDVLWLRDPRRARPDGLRRNAGAGSPAPPRAIPGGGRAVQPDEEARHGHRLEGAHGRPPHPLAGGSSGPARGSSQRAAGGRAERQPAPRCRAGKWQPRGPLLGAGARLFRRRAAEVCLWLRAGGGAQVVGPD